MRSAKRMNRALGDQQYMPDTAQTISKASLQHRGVRAERTWEHFVSLSSTCVASEELMKKDCKSR